MTNHTDNKPPLWTLDEALKLVREIQPMAHANGYHVGIGGGVLNKGSSDKDLDLMMMPLNKNDITFNYEPVISAISDALSLNDRVDYTPEYGIRIVDHTLIILRGEVGSKRVDIFISAP